mmetsp:Transcript_27339/g.44509  ORF Transcript_27339/g.44509 Transcript_27339/m.44509 type:complete len:123 (+) Transcript_27339:1945-2313(+)
MWRPSDYHLKTLVSSHSTCLRTAKGGSENGQVFIMGCSLHTNTRARKDYCDRVGSLVHLQYTKRLAGVSSPSHSARWSSVWWVQVNMIFVLQCWGIYNSKRWVKGYGPVFIYHRMLPTYKHR